jgi:hypothetical protein
MFSRTLYVTCILLISVNIIAQDNKLIIGKKYTLVTEGKTNSALSLMGQQVDINGTVSSTAELSFQTIKNADSYKLLLTMKRLKGVIGAMGQQQDFDSDDESTRNNPLLGGMLKIIDQPQEWIVENGQTMNSENKNDILSQMGSANTVDVTKLRLGLPVNKIILGYQWSDSSFSENANQINQYTISRIANSEIEISVSTQMKMNGTITQSGIEMKQNLIGTSTSIRLYNPLNSLLISEKTAIEMTGTSEMMGMSGPLSMKSSNFTLVKE